MKRKLSKNTLEQVLEHLRRIQGKAPSSPAGADELTGADKKLDFTIVLHAREIQACRCRDIEQRKNYDQYSYEASSVLRSFLTADFALYADEELVYSDVCKLL